MGAHGERDANTTHTTGLPFDFFNGTKIFFHRVLRLSGEPYAGVDRSILRMKVGSARKASQKFFSGAVDFYGGKLNTHQ